MVFWCYVSPYLISYLSQLVSALLAFHNRIPFEGGGGGCELMYVRVCEGERAMDWVGHTYQVGECA